MQGANFNPEYLKINKNGTIPTYIIDGKTYDDSTVSQTIQTRSLSSLR